MEYLNTAQELLDFIMRCKMPVSCGKRSRQIC